MVPITTAIVPRITGVLNISNCRLNKNDSASKKTVVVDSSGVTTLAGESFRDKKRIRLAIPASKPMTQYKPMSFLFIPAKAALLFGLTKDKLRTAAAARKEIKTPATGEPGPLSPSFIRIGDMPQDIPDTNPNKNALRDKLTNKP